MGVSLDWVWQVCGGSFAVGALALFIWAIFWDRARGRRRCPRCWYDMAGVPGLRCPECGREAKAEARLHRSRRRLAWAFVSIPVGLAGIAGACWPAYQRGGYVALVPTVGLVLLAPIDAPSGGPSFGAAPSTGSVGGDLCAELWMRFHAGGMSAWEERWVVRRYLAVALPKCAGAIWAPERWPVDAPMRIRVGPLPLSRLCGGSAMVSLQCGSEPVNWLGQSTIGPYEGVYELRAAGNPAESLDFTVGVHTDRVSEQGTFSCAVHLAGDTASFMDRIDSVEVNERIQQALSPRIEHRNDGPRLVFADRSDSSQWAGIDCEVACRFEILVDGRRVGSGRWEAALTPVKNTSKAAIVEWNDGLSPRRAEIVVWGDPEAGGRLFLKHPFDRDRPTCWTGQFRMSLPQEASR